MRDVNNAIMVIAFILCAISLTLQVYSLASTWAGVFLLTYFANIVYDYYNGDR